MSFFFKDLETGVSIGDQKLEIDCNDKDSLHFKNEKFLAIIKKPDREFTSGKKIKRKFSQIFLDVIAPQVLKEVDARKSEHRHSIGKYTSKLDLIIESLVPNSDTANAENFKKIVKKSIIESPDNTATGVIGMYRLIKKMSNEIKVMKSLARKDETLNLQNHDLKKVVLSIYHLSANELKTKSIDIDVKDMNSEKLRISYIHIQGLLIQLFDNAAKFCKHDSTITFKSKIFSNAFVLEMEMFSRFADVDDPGIFFEHGVSWHYDDIADSQGIGLHTCKRIVDKLKGEINFFIGQNIVTENDKEYSKNKFIIKIPY